MNVQTPNRRDKNEGFGDNVPAFMNNGIFSQNPRDSYELNQGEKTGKVVIETEKGTYTFNIHINDIAGVYEGYVGGHKRLCYTPGLTIERVAQNLTGRLGEYIREDFEKACGTAVEKTRSELMILIEQSCEKKYDSNIPGQESDLRFGNIDFEKCGRNGLSIIVILHGRKKKIGKSVWSFKNIKGQQGYLLSFTSSEETIPNLSSGGTCKENIADELLENLNRHLHQISPDEFPLKDGSSLESDSLQEIKGEVEGFNYTLRKTGEQRGVIEFTYEKVPYAIDVRIIQNKGKIVFYVPGKSSEKKERVAIANRFRGGNKDKNKAANACFRKIVHALKSTNAQSQLFRDTLAQYKV